MPNPVKYSTVTPSGSLRKGNMAIGVNPNVALGPTSVTGFYAGITPPSGGYTIYQNKVSQGPSIYVASNDSGLIRLTKEISGTTYANVAGCLNYFAGQTDKIIIASSDNIPASTTSGSILNLNAGMVCSYPTTSSTWYDISGNNNNGILTNGPTYNNGSIVFDGVDDYAYFTSPNSLLTPTFTVCSVITPITVANNGTVVLTNESARLNLGISYGGASGAYFFVTGNNGQGINGTQASYNFSFGTNTKYFVVWIVDIPGRNFQFWVNGTQIWSSNVDLGTNFNNPTTNGFVLASRYGGGSSQVNIGISNFQFYNKVLSQSEILQNYYQSPIVTDGLIFAADAGNLVSYQSGSTTTYSLTGSLSGSLVNGTGYNNTNGGSWVFDGVDDYILQNAFIDAGSNFSVFAWIKPGGGINVRNGIIGNSYPYNSRQGFFLSTATNYAGTLNTFFISIGGDAAYRTANNNSITLNTWNYVGGVVINGGEDIKLYVNGIETSYSGGVLNSGTITYSTNQFYVGARVGGNLEPFVGNIATSQIYNRVLSSTEIQQNFKAQKNRFGL